MDKEVRKKFFSIWRKMKDRCDNPKNLEYHNYGGSGVYYTPRWKVFENFIEDVRFIPGYNTDKIISGYLQLDKDYRYIGNKEYSKDTCLWIRRDYNMLYQPNRNSGIYAYNPELDILESYLSPAWFAKVHHVNSGTCSHYSNEENKRAIKGYYLWKRYNRPPLMYYYVGKNEHTGEKFISNKVSPLCQHFNLNRRCASRSIYSNGDMRNPTHSTNGVIVYKRYMSINAQRLSKVDTSFRDLWKKLVE